MVLAAGEFLELADQAAEDVRIVVAGLALEYHAETLEAHSGIDVLCREGLQMAIGHTVVLHEHEVPYLDDLVVVRVDKLGARLGCNLFVGTEVDMDLAARTAWACITHFPEIVVLVSKEDMILRHMFFPGLASLGIEFCAIFGRAFEYGRIKLGLVNLVNFCEKFPCPVDRLCLEIVSETPVSEHLEHGVVTSVVTHRLEVVVLSAHAEALLAVCRPAELRCAVSEENVFELVHSGIGKHQCRVVLYDHRS